jgi:hypothetical protein
MASIFPRKNKDGSFVWRLQIRRKGIKSFITSFSTREEAEKFSKENESKYVLNPEKFTFSHLQRRRENEFSRKP